MKNLFAAKVLLDLKQLSHGFKIPFSSTKGPTKSAIQRVIRGVQTHQNKVKQSEFNNSGTNVEEMSKLELEQRNENRVLKHIEIKSNWYSKAADFWEGCEATYAGVLGGYPEINAFDIPESDKFLTDLILEEGIDTNRAIDCGGGIGRVCEQLLCKKFKEVDLVDQNPKYIIEAQKNLRDCQNMRDFYVKGLQEFEFKKQYDCIWIQWVSGQLTDDDYVLFLKNCARGLTLNGIIIIKENISDQGFLVHKTDFSVTRSHGLLCALFQKAGLTIIKTRLQKEFPEDFLKVCQYALKTLNQGSIS